MTIEQLQSALNDLITSGFWFIFGFAILTFVKGYITMFIKALQIKKGNILFKQLKVEIDGYVGRIVSIGWTQIILDTEDGTIYIPIAELSSKTIKVFYNMSNVSKNSLDYIIEEAVEKKLAQQRKPRKS